MKKIVVLAAVAVGVLALTFAAVAVPREAAACSRACINCCNWLQAPRSQHRRLRRRPQSGRDFVPEARRRGSRGNQLRI